MFHKYLILLSILFISTGQLLAQDDYSKGKQLYQKNCYTCHGQAGVNMNTPVLYGQELEYIQSSLKKFKSHKRMDNIMYYMNSMASTLTDDQIKQVSLYLTAQDPCKLVMDIDVDESGFIEKFKAGRSTVTKKNCMHCHASFHHQAPRLLGQKKNYIKTSLIAFKNNTRQGFPMMNRIASKLTDEEIQNISTYLNGMKLMRDCQASKK